jgi:hypothetical protein
LSCAPDIPSKTVTGGQLIAGVVTVAGCFRARFALISLCLLGLSCGWFLGIQVAAMAPGRLHTVVGMGQVPCQLLTEVIAHAKMILQDQACGDTATVRSLAQAQSL